MSDTENTAYIPFSGVSEADYVVVKQEAPKIGWRYNADTTHPHDWEGYIKVTQSGVHMFSATIDDNGYIEIAGQRVVSLEGTHSQTNVSGSISLNAGYHWVKLHHENGAGPLVQAGAANAEVFIPKMDGADLELYTIVAKNSEHSPVSLAVEFTSTSSVIGSQKNLETNNTYSASGLVFNGILTVTYGDGHSMTMPVQSGGWMANASPWVERTLMDSQGNQISPPPASGTFNPEDYPDTACPSSVNRIVTTFRNQEGRLKGFVLNNHTVAGSNHPDNLRSGLLLHIAKRIGSEGCISTFDYVKWEILKGDMKVIEGNPETLPITVSYSGVVRDALRQPESV